MTPTQQVREMLADGYDADTVVSVLVARADTSELRSMAASWIRGSVEQEQRRIVRATEREQFAIRRAEQARVTAESSKALAGKIVAAVRFTDEFLAMAFSLPGGRSVTWGEATAVDHAERCEMLAQRIDGMTETMGQHKEICDLLIRAGAKCLNDIKFRER